MVSFNVSPTNKYRIFNGFNLGADNKLTNSESFFLSALVNMKSREAP